MEPDHEDQLERRRDELRRIVYGTREGAGSDAVVELAAVELELAARTRETRRDVHDLPAASDEPAASDRPGASDTPAASDRPGASDTPAASDTPVASGRTAMSGTPPSGRPRRVRAAIVAGAIAVLALAAAGVALLGPARDMLSPPRGLAVFERDQTPEERDRADRVASAAGLQPTDASALRSLGRAFGYDFWVFRDADEVCLLSQRPYFFVWVESCASIEDFAEDSLIRRIPADDIRNGAWPPAMGPGDVLVVTWGPESAEVGWSVEP